MSGRPPHRPTGKTPAQDHSQEGQISHESVELTADAHEYTVNPRDHEKGHKEAGKKGRRGGRPQSTGEGAAR